MPLSTWPTKYPAVHLPTSCAQAISFCRKLNWGSLASVLEAYAGRLSFGVTEELLPLVRLGAQVTLSALKVHLHSAD